MRSTRGLWTSKFSNGVPWGPHSAPGRECVPPSYAVVLTLPRDKVRMAVQKQGRDSKMATNLDLRLLAYWAAAGAMLAAGNPAHCAGRTVSLEPDFQLQDFLGRSWTNESVRFPLSPEQLAKARRGQVLAAEGVGQVLYQ